MFYRKYTLAAIKKIHYVILTLCFASTVFAASSYDSAVELTSARVTHISRVLQGFQNEGNGFNISDKDRSFYVKGKKVGVIERDIVNEELNIGRIFVYLRSIEDIKPAEGEDIINPYIKATTKLFQKEGIFRIVDEVMDFEKDDITFCGIGSSGSTACVLAQELLTSKMRRGDIKNDNNQIKVVMFSPTGIGTEDYVYKVHSHLNRRNILSFYDARLTDNLYDWWHGYKTCGVPVKILFSEQVGDSLSHTYRSLSFPEGKVFAMGLLYLGWSVFDIYNHYSIFKGKTHWESSAFGSDHDISWASDVVHMIQSNTTHGKMLNLLFVSSLVSLFKPKLDVPLDRTVELAFRDFKYNLSRITEDPRKYDRAGISSTWDWGRGFWGFSL